ncbi:hypothetical protein EON77_14405 [bacterium]|nr:MAG: hypothetical protein EON77_14405 [bacterium]
MTLGSDAPVPDLSRSDLFRAGSGDPFLARLLAAHPEVRGGFPTDHPGIAFGRRVDRYVGPDLSGGAARVLDGVGGDARGGEGRSGPGLPFGLIEHMDNNPLVCADLARVPSAAQTLVLVALGPLLKTGLILEPPAITIDIECDEDEIVEALRTEDPGTESVTLSVGPSVHPSVRRLHAVVAVRNPRSLDEFDEAYAERYDRALYVRRREENEFSPENVADRPWAEFILRISPGDDASLLAISAIADLRGKLGQAQVVHTMNVMAGFEESLGIPELLPH